MYIGFFFLFQYPSSIFGHVDLKIKSWYDFFPFPINIICCIYGLGSHILMTMRPLSIYQHLNYIFIVKIFSHFLILHSSYFQSFPRNLKIRCVSVIFLYSSFQPHNAQSAHYPHLKPPLRILSANIKCTMWFINWRKLVLSRSIEKINNMHIVSIPLKIQIPDTTLLLCILSWEFPKQNPKIYNNKL